VLKGLRVTYWERESDLDPHDLDQVGVMLETPDPEKPYFIVGIAAKNGKLTVEGIGVGDKPGPG